MELIDEVHNSVNNYFSALSHSGYKPYSEVNQLIILIFIEELLYGPLSEFVTEEDYKLIDKMLYCLYGSCMIPYPDYKGYFNYTINKMIDRHRVTESISPRITELSDLRIES